MSARLCLSLPLIYGLFEGKDYVECISVSPALNIVPRSRRFSISLWMNIMNLCKGDFMKIVAMWPVNTALLVRPIFGVFGYPPGLFCSFR